MFTLEHNQLLVAFPELHKDARLSISFQRTLRIPDDNRPYPLPPGLGEFPLRHIDDFADRVPTKWREHGGVFLPMHQAEAMWICFHNHSDYPLAVKIAAGKINAVSGEPWTNELDFDEQDYVVVPGQPWLDGFCVSKGNIRQFVAMPLGSGYSAEEQLTGKAEHGGLQFVVYPLKPEHYTPPRREWMRACMSTGIDFDKLDVCCASTVPDMALAPGGLMKQDIYEDDRPRDQWKTDVFARCFVHLLNSAQYEVVTGQRPPTRPPTAEDYTRAGLPWFDYYRDAPALDGGKPLKGLDSIAALGIKKSEQPLPENEPVQPTFVTKLGPRANAVRDGKF